MEQTCGIQEHQHSADKGCYDADGNLVCQLQEHTHDDSCYEDVRTLTCGMEEYEGHHHTDACYEKVLVCGKEVHTHSEKCYEEDGSTDSAEDGDSAGMPSDSADEGDIENTEETGDTGNSVPETSDSDASVSEEQSDSYMPELEPLDMEAVLNSHTDFYYFHAEEGEEVPANSAEITEWKKVDEETTLASTDLVKLYLAYTIPAGSLNATNPTARYRLPDNIHLSDEQIKAINLYENGIAAGYRETGAAAAEKDEKEQAENNYKKYLGVEAVEGDRRPDEQLMDGAQEFISAVVRAENVYDEEGLYGKKGAYLGQDLIFTFVPYSIEKNQNTYDADKTLISAGEKITGWFACDFKLNQIDWEQEDENKEEDIIREDTNGEEITDEDSIGEDDVGQDGNDNDVENTDSKDKVKMTAKVIFVQEDQEKEIEEISRMLRMNGTIEDGTSSETMTDANEETGEDQDDMDDQGDQVFKAGTLTFEGDDYSITLDYGEDAKIPENASLSVREITAETDKEAYEACLEQAGQQVAADDNTTVDQKASRFFDIEILVTEMESDGTEKTVKIEPAAPVSVSIQINEKPASQESESDQSEPTVLHFAEEGVEQIDSTVTDSQNNDEEDQKTEIQFEAESFSVYGVVYTVDFHLEVDGKMYEFSIPGGGFVSLEHVVEVLGIASVDENTDNEAENTENGAENEDDFVGEVPGADVSDENGTAYEEAIKLNELEVSEATKKFVADVESVEFSNPELVWVGKVDSAATVGGLKEANGLEVEYSADLTEEQIAEINAQTVEAGDWALISLQPFSSEETLTITMADDKMFEIRVTDAIVSSDNLEEDKQYILYAVTPFGAYYALKNDGSCVRVYRNNLDTLGDEFLWSVEQPDWDTDWNKNIKMWRSVVGNYAINLWWENKNTAVANDPSHTYLESAGNGGYYFKTNNYGNGNRTFALWLKLDMSDWTWNFVVGDAKQGNQSRIYIYEQETHHQLTVNVDDENSNAGWVYINNGWQHEGKIDIGANGYNAESIVAAPGSGSGYWFDHWELDGNTVPESDSIRTYQQNGDIYCIIEEGGLYIGNEDSHVLTAVFVAETSFNVEAGEGGTVNVTTSPRTRDGYNKSVITATANDGYWFDHWEVDGQTVEGDVQAEEDGSKCTVPKGGIHVGEGETLKAVFIPEVKYDVVVTKEEGGTAQGCTVKVGNGTPDTNVPNNKMDRAGFNIEDIVATAGPGYVFKGWLLDDEPILGDAVESAADGSTSKIKAGKLQIGTEEGHTIKAVFAQEYTFVVTTTPSGAGKVQDDSKTAAETIAGSMTKDNKNKYDIKALPNSGYKLMYWTLNGQPLMDKNDETAYAYINGNNPTIPAGELDIISSDELCAVFVKDAYKITSTSAGNGHVSPSSVYTESNNESSKKARQEITATPNNNYKFAYWKVDPIDAVENWGSGKAVNSTTIQPTVNTDTALKAFFVPTNTRIYTVRVDNPEHGRVYSDVDVLGQSATVNNEVNPNFIISNYGETSFVLRTNSSNKNEGGVEVRTTLNGYEFVGWKLYHSNGRLYQDYTSNNNLKNYRITKNTLTIPYDDMLLEACFQKRETPEAFQDESVADLDDWASEKAGTEFDLDKTAEVFDYDNRIYRINMSAASKKEAIDSSVVLNFITDVSRSMYFPANLTTVKNNYGQDDSYNKNLANWLNDKSKNNVYYISYFAA